MQWGDLLPGLWSLFCHHGPPHGLLIQLGENDITLLQVIDLKKDMEALLQVMHSSYPNVTLLWSQVLQRRCCWWVRHPGKIKMVRRKLDKAVGHLVTSFGGFWIKYPNITLTDQDMYWTDGVHLSEKGNTQWVMDIRKAI
ncbi:hypothetical protein JRQ81_017000, partial [Phrynocephalus forsythii]